MAGAEAERLEQDARRERNWKRWGPYLAERQWGTVREDYSADGNVWDYFPHDQSRSRAYRWGEDGLLGITDRQGRLCFALALWNGRDPILKERLFGLTGPEGNHGEDVKELLLLPRRHADALLPQGVSTSIRRPLSRTRSWSVSTASAASWSPSTSCSTPASSTKSATSTSFAEYAKEDAERHARSASPSRTAGPTRPTLHLLPTLWFRNTWSWGRQGEGYWPSPSVRRRRPGHDHRRPHGARSLRARSRARDGAAPALLFTENETNLARLFGTPNPQPYVKDAFHRAVIDGEAGAVNPAGEGTKAALHYVLTVPAGGRARRPAPAPPGRSRGHAERSAPRSSGCSRPASRRPTSSTPSGSPAAATADERRVLRQGYAGLLWSKQFYHYISAHWLEGDPSSPRRPRAAARAATRSGPRSTTATSSRCRTSGSTPGSRPGTWPST